MLRSSPKLFMLMKETNLEIKTYPDQFLRRKTKPVIQITEKERVMLSEMAQLMYQHAGVGLAANQVGLDQAMLVADAGCGLYKLINPKITKRSGEEVMEEGCLSVPGVCVKIRRAASLAVEAKDENAKPVTIHAEGLLARILQHEIDHLSGNLIIDRANLFEKIKIKKILKKLREKSYEKLS